MKKKLAIFLALVLAIAMLPITAQAADYQGKTVVIYTGNIRGNIDALPLIAAVRADFEAKGAEVILVDTGNFLQGTRYATFNSGSTMITLMLATGYDIVALGAYDFAFGTGTLGTAFHGDAVDFGPLGELLEMNPALSAVSANISGQNEYFHSFSASASTQGSINLGFIGLTDESTPARILESNLVGMQFTSGAASAQTQAQYMAGYDLVIGLSNASVSGIDGVIMLDVAPVAVPGVITVGAVVICNETLEYTRQTVTLTDFTPYPVVDELVNEFRLAVDGALPLIGQSGVTLDGSATSTRSGETALGNLWADALRWFAVSGEIDAFFDEDDVAAGNDTIHVPASHVVALWNAGNLRDFIYPGDVTVQDLRRVLPFPNTVAVVYLTGAELLEQLEASAQGLPLTDETFPLTASFMHVSGIEYTVDTTRAFNPGEAYRDRIWHQAESIERVTITSINGEPFDPAAIYAVITSNANFNGMDISYVLAAREGDADNRSTITTARVTENAVAGFIASLPGQTIGAEQAQTQGRITVAGTAQAPLTEADSIDEADSVDEADPTGETDPDPAYEAGDTPQDTFIPTSRYLTRSMFIYILYLMEGAPAVEATTRFTDVPQGHPHTTAIAWATNEGLISGVNATHFAPDRYITMQEVAVVTHRFLGSPVATGSLTYYDAGDIASWAYDAVLYLSTNGLLVDETEGNIFGPTQRISVDMALIEAALATLAELAYLNDN